MNQQEVEQLLTDRFNPSFLSGDVGQARDNAVEDEACGAGDDRMAALDDWIRADIKKLIWIEQNYPIRGWLSDDGYDAGVLLLESVRKNHMDVFKKYTALFWGRAHGDVCRIFKAELVAVWRRYKNIQWPAGLDKSGFVLEA